MHKTLIGITMGDPAGIGPELCLRALNDKSVLEHCVPVVFGDSEILQRVSGITGLQSPPRAVTPDEWDSCDRPAVIHCESLRGARIEPARIQAECGLAAYTYIKTAAKAAVDGRISAVATAPIHKEAMRAAGIVLPGHTEIFAELTATRQFCMMMASEKLKVSLVTTHVGYAEAPSLITTERIIRVIELTADALRHLGKVSPRISVCALNPHAGENGLFGNEEEEVIEPAIADAQLNGIKVNGPLPPDTAFAGKMLESADAYVAMYHDQGLIPFKMLSFGSGVNVTLGIPIIRTSVDHGTAFDIAWRGKASASSMIQSILWAVKLAGAYR